MCALLLCVCSGCAKEEKTLGNFSYVNGIYVPSETTEDSSVEADNVSNTVTETASSGAFVSSLLPNESTSMNSNDVTVGEPTGELLDLTQFSTTVLNAELVNIMTTPDNYLGKAVKMTGSANSYTDSTTGMTYYYAEVYDETACCSFGLEYILDDGNYPITGQMITIEGDVGVYDELGYTYCVLVNTTLY